MVIVNARGEMVLVNAQTEKMFGYARQEILGKPVEMLVPGARCGPSIGSIASNYFQEPGRSAHGHGHATARPAQGGPRVSCRNQPQSAEDRGGRAGVRAPFATSRVRQETEEKLRQAERLAAIGEMIAGLAHESRNALQQSQACLELLALKVEHWPDIADLVADVQKAQDHLHYLYEEVRGYAAPIKLHPERTDLGRLLDGNLGSALGACSPGPAGQPGPEDARASPWNAPSIRKPCGHVLRNILENSLQACPDPVEIRATFEDAELKGRPALRLTLADNGPGLTPEARKKIFQPFFTTKIQGTGLGLAITRRIVEAHGGVIAGGNDRQPGMEILITLPR